ncbi:hypothetical protein Barb4_02137 [Bacteroidales bacterium Barb4]|nr:hypothetical protein Barb4_02137 [Bacteroidales bacterium Barb4]
MYIHIRDGTIYTVCSRRFISSGETTKNDTDSNRITDLRSGEEVAHKHSLIQQLNRMAGS